MRRAVGACVVGVVEVGAGAGRSYSDDVVEESGAQAVGGGGCAAAVLA